MTTVESALASPAVADARADSLHYEALPEQILERMDEGFFAIDRGWRFTYVNRSAELFWGRDRADLLGRDMRVVFPKFAGSDSHKAHEKAFATGEHLRIETVSTATGAQVALSLYPDPSGLSVFFHDITHRHEMESALRERDETLSLAERSAGIGVWDADLRTGTFRGTPQFFLLMGLTPTTEPQSMEVSRAVRHPEDRDRVVQGFADALTSGADVYDSEYRIILPSGEVRWIFGRGRVIRDASGVPVRYSGIDIDVTERKRHEDHLRLVMKELIHRTNNLLAVIQAIFRQTAKRSAGIEDFERRFSSRLMSLANSNELLVRQDWRGSAVEELIRAQLAPFVGNDEARLNLAGPSAFLKPLAVQNLGLAFHELATNAAKYGALSQPDGRVNINWAFVGGESEQRKLKLVWRESGGPRVKTPRRTGLGRFVVETMITRALDAAVSIDFAPDGVIWTIELGDANLTSPEAGVSV